MEDINRSEEDESEGEIAWLIKKTTKKSVFH